MRLSTLLTTLAVTTAFLLPFVVALPTEVNLAKRQGPGLLYENLDDAINNVNIDPTVESMSSLLDFLAYEVNLMNIDPRLVVGFYGYGVNDVAAAPAAVKPAAVAPASSSAPGKSTPASSSTHVSSAKPSASAAKAVKVPSVSLSVGPVPTSSKIASSSKAVSSKAASSSAHPVKPSARAVTRQNSNPIIQEAINAAYDLVALGYNLPSYGPMSNLYAQIVAGFIQLAEQLDPYIPGIEYAVAPIFNDSN